MTMNRVLATLLALATTALLSGCMNMVPTIPEMMARSKWEGKPIKDAVAKWGPPAGVTQAKDGQRVAYWSGSSLTTVREALGQTVEPGGPGLIITSHYADRVITNNCTLTLKFNQDNIITKFDTWENRSGACGDFYWGSNSP